jgi:hypothetical protein
MNFPHSCPLLFLVTLFRKGSFVDKRQGQLSKTWIFNLIFLSILAGDDFELSSLNFSCDCNFHTLRKRFIDKPQALFYIQTLLCPLPFTTVAKPIVMSVFRRTSLLVLKSSIGWENCTMQKQMSPLRTNFLSLILTMVI